MDGWIDGWMDGWMFCFFLFFSCNAAPIEPHGMPSPAPSRFRRAPLVPPPPGSTYRVSAGNRMPASVDSATPEGLKAKKKAGTLVRWYAGTLVR